MLFRSEPPADLDGSPCAIGDIWSYADENVLYVGNTGMAVTKFRWTVTSEDNTNDLRTYLENEIATFKGRAGNIITEVSTFTAPEDGISSIDSIENYDHTLDKLIVNYNQTILREHVDYTIDSETGQFTLVTFTLNKDDVLQFTVLKQDPDA